MHSTSLYGEAVSLLRCSVLELALMEITINDPEASLCNVGPWEEFKIFSLKGCFKGTGGV